MKENDVYGVTTEAGLEASRDYGLVIAGETWQRANAAKLGLDIG